VKNFIYYDVVKQKMMRGIEIISNNILNVLPSKPNSPILSERPLTPTQIFNQQQLLEKQQLSNKHDGEIICPHCRHTVQAYVKGNGWDHCKYCGFDLIKNPPIELSEQPQPQPQSSLPMNAPPQPLPQAQAPLLCPNCHSPIQADWKTCQFCGYSLTPINLTLRTEENQILELSLKEKAKQAVRNLISTDIAQSYQSSKKKLQNVSNEILNMAGLNQTGGVYKRDSDSSTNYIIEDTTGKKKAR
jgi:uncharacterized CHY-type Zn-finger protein